MSGLREALVELADEWGRYGPMAPAVLAEVDSILAARQAPTVALGVEMVARIQFEASARMVALEVGLDDPVTWAELGDKDRQHLLDCAAAVVAADPRRSEAEVKAEGQVEVLREAADLCHHADQARCTWVDCPCRAINALAARIAEGGEG